MTEETPTPENEPEEKEEQLTAEQQHQLAQMQECFQLAYGAVADLTNTNFESDDPVPGVWLLAALQGVAGALLERTFGSVVDSQVPLNPDRTRDEIARGVIESMTFVRDSSRISTTNDLIMQEKEAQGAAKPH